MIPSERFYLNCCTVNELLVRSTLSLLNAVKLSPITDDEMLSEIQPSFNQSVKTMKTDEVKAYLPPST
jgi:hypothetical protein